MSDRLLAAILSAVFFYWGSVADKGRWTLYAFGIGCAALCLISIVLGLIPDEPRKPSPWLIVRLGDEKQKEKEDV